MTNEMIGKAKECKSVEELLVLAKENNYPMTESEAEAVFNTLHSEGEISDDEVESVSGGACQTKMKVDGKTYVVVSSAVSCFTGEFEPVNSQIKQSLETGSSAWQGEVVWFRKDNKTLRKTWCDWGWVSNNSCGACYHLEFNGGIGYCGKSCK